MFSRPPLLSGLPGGLALGVLVGGLRVLMPLLAVLLGRLGVLLRLVLLALLMMMGSLQVMVRRRGVVRRRLVMALVRRVLTCGGGHKLYPLGSLYGDGSGHTAPRTSRSRS